MTEDTDRLQQWTLSQADMDVETLREYVGCSEEEYISNTSWDKHF